MNYDYFRSSLSIQNALDYGKLRYSPTGGLSTLFAQISYQGLQYYGIRGRIVVIDKRVISLKGGKNVK